MNSFWKRLKEMQLFYHLLSERGTLPFSIKIKLLLAHYYPDKYLNFKELLKKFEPKRQSDNPLERMWNVPLPPVDETLARAHVEAKLRWERDKAAGIVRLTSNQFIVGDYILSHPDMELHSRVMSERISLPHGLLKNENIIKNGFRRFEENTILTCESDGESRICVLTDANRLREILAFFAKDRMKLSKFYGGDFLPEGIDDIMLTQYLPPDWEDEELPD